MALDTRLPLVDVSADSAGALTQGANLGLGLSRAYSQAKDAQAQRKRMGIEDAQKNAMSVYSVLGDEEINKDNYGDMVGRMKAAGIPLEADDEEFSDINLQQINSMREAGRGLTRAGQPQEAKVGRYRSIDLGDRVILFDSVTSEVVKTAEKGVSDSDQQIADLKAQEIELSKQAKQQQIEAKEAEEERKAQEAEVKAQEAEKAAQKSQMQTEETLTTIDTILKSPAFEDVVGTGVRQRFPTWSAESQDLINDFDRLVSSLTAENLDLLSGVLSDTDIKLLKDLSSGINLVPDSDGKTKYVGGSPAGVRDRLVKIAEKLRTVEMPKEQTAEKPLTEMTLDERRARLAKLKSEAQL